jgi:hypothetical protein
VSGIWTAQTGWHFTATRRPPCRIRPAGGADRPNRIADEPAEQFDVDLGIHRFRAEMLNAFNHNNFNNPNTTIGNAQAGVVSGTGAARVMQMALKALFYTGVLCASASLRLR